MPKEWEHMDNPLAWMHGLNLSTNAGEVFFGTYLPHRLALSAKVVGGVKRKPGEQRQTQTVLHSVKFSSLPK